jgi:hypothetical protein
MWCILSGGIAGARLLLVHVASGIGGGWNAAWGGLRDGHSGG